MKTINTISFLGKLTESPQYGNFQIKNDKGITLEITTKDKLAEAIQTYLTIGSTVLIEGELLLTGQVLAHNINFIRATQKPIF